MKDHSAERKLTRRTFIRASLAAAGLAATGSLLAACGDEEEEEAPAGAPAAATATSPAAEATAAATSPPAASPAGSPVAAGEEGPWSEAPDAPKPDQLAYVVWQYGNIYEQITPRFIEDWDVQVNPIIEPNVEPMVAKLTTMFAAGEQIDVTQAPFQFLGSFIDQGIVEPIDGLPGADQYINDFTPFTRAIAQQRGKTWGLPYFSTVWMPIYNEERLQQAGFDAPFTSWDELIEQARKAKQDGIVRYPILWVAGAGFEQLPGTWFVLTYNRGGVIFDQDLNPQLGPGSVARETLAWWQQTFTEELADPQSLEVRFIPAAKAFNTGDNLYLLPLHHYYISLVNDPAQSPIAGKGKHALMPGDGKTLGYTVLYLMSSATAEKEWAWKLLQYLGGRTKDGVYTQAEQLARDAMLGSGYQSVMNSDVIKEGWSKWGDPELILKQWETAANWIEPVPAVNQPWYSKWSDAVNVELTNCLSGQITPDEACDNMTAAVDAAKQSR